MFIPWLYPRFDTRGSSDVVMVGRAPGSGWAGQGQESGHRHNYTMVGFEY